MIWGGFGVGGSPSSAEMVSICSRSSGDRRHSHSTAAAVSISSSVWRMPTRATETAGLPRTQQMASWATDLPWSAARFLETDRPGNFDHGPFVRCGELLCRFTGALALVDNRSGDAGAGDSRLPEPDLRIYFRRPVVRGIQKPQFVWEPVYSSVHLLHALEQLCVHFKLAISAEVEILARRLNKHVRSVSKETIVSERMSGSFNLSEIVDSDPDSTKAYGVEVA